MLSTDGVAQGLMTLTTLYALYGEDVRLAAFPKAADATFYALSAVALSLFAIELALGSWARKGFFLSFFWWLDLIATLSLVADIPWIVDPIESLFTSDSQSADDGEASEAATATRAGRAARAGTRAGRIIRIVRVVRVLRLVRVMRLLKYSCMNKDQRALHISNSKSAGADSSSQTGRVLSEQITKQTVIGVLLFILVFPFLNVHEVRDRFAYNLNALINLEDVVLTKADGDTLDILRTRLRDWWYAVRVECYGLFLDDSAGRLPLRDEEMEVISFKGRTGSTVITGIFDISKDTQNAALYAIGFTSFIIFMLGVAAYFFTRISNKYCIAPIESMMSMMREFSANPLDKMGEKAMNAGAHSETSQLMNSISKIGALLQIGFGEAGAVIIGTNLAAGGDINPMVPGRKMVALFGFVVIFGFTDATESLREGVMLYVNRIAAIVHSCVHEFAGAVNKNIGEAFLMVWPLAHRTEKRERAEKKRRSSVTGSPSSRPGSPARTASRSPSPTRSLQSRLPSPLRRAPKAPPGIVTTGAPGDDIRPPPLITHGSEEGTEASSPSPPLSPSRGIPVDNHIGVPRTPNARSSVDGSTSSPMPTERMYVLPVGTHQYTTADCAVAGFALCVLLIKANKQLHQLCQNQALQKLCPGSPSAIRPAEHPAL